MTFASPYNYFTHWQSSNYSDRSSKMELIKNWNSTERKRW